jgi:antirestriction protein ArdC
MGIQCEVDTPEQLEHIAFVLAWNVMLHDDNLRMVKAQAEPSDDVILLIESRRSPRPRNGSPTRY